MIADVPGARPVAQSRLVFQGGVWDVRSDDVDLGESGVVTRDYIHHTGAVAIMALNDADELYLVRQYRHPVQAETWEPPAGLLDLAGEPPVDAAARELHEEADLRAGRWDTLLDFMTSPGGSSEGIRIFLARDLSEVPEAERHARHEEERDMEGRWVPLAEVLASIWAGEAQSPTIVAGALALDAAKRSGWELLRPADAPWRRPPSLLD
ncbi:NUDIX domain-containing protein [Demequina mangrovi]|uniref:ADP-ribose pyrophosphatase n=1 Tax=Demequina mangrovi TaxID=1043493 RepID=A0A1H7B6V3_9MICO|nr:NUDIX hydrolase [Demequina mangrovi]SEJ70010.1 ADP-ribose pyrophosphatase [Demequina mangrovi]